MRIDSDGSSRPASWVLALVLRALFLLLSLGLQTRSRRIHRAAATLQLLANGIVGREKRPGPGWKRWHFVGVQRSNQSRRDQHHQLGSLRSLGLALEQRADDRKTAQNRHRGTIFLRDVVQEPGNRERLTVPELDVGFRPPC